MELIIFVVVICLSLLVFCYLLACVFTLIGIMLKEVEWKDFLSDSFSNWITVLDAVLSSSSHTHSHTHTHHHGGFGGGHSRGGGGGRSF